MKKKPSFVRVTISMKPDELEMIDHLAEAIGLERSKFIVWVIKTTSEFIVAPDIKVAVKKKIKEMTR